MSPVRRLVRREAVSGRALRCLAVSVFTTVLSAVVLVALVLGADVRPGLANVVAVCCGIPVSYAANRRWTWARAGRGSLTREVAPFWVLSLAGLACSTVAVAVIGGLSADWPDAVRAIALPVAEAGSFALLWIVQFVLLERVIFRPAAPSPAAGPPPPTTPRPRTPVAV